MAKRSFTRCSTEWPFPIKKRYSGSSWSNGETTTSQYCGGEKQSSILRTYTQAGTQKRRKTMLHKRLVPRTWHLLYCDKTRIFALQCETCSRRYSTPKTLQHFRVVLHAIHHNRLFDNIIVSARNTDVLLLLLAHLNYIICTLWLWVGTSKKPKYIPVNKVFEIFHKVQKGRYCSSCNHW